ncbi:MAG: hypothetical protein ACYTF9_06930 [Planctomycetota bacterium]|jgi:hypothetical protein
MNTIPRIPPLFLSAALLLVAMAIAGCNILGPAFFILHGPPRTPAMYELEDRKTLVFIDDRNSTIPLNKDSIRRTIGQVTSENLMTKKVLTETVRPEDAIALSRANDRFNETMAIDEIGRQVGADQVIYVNMVGFELTPDGVTPNPGAAAYIKVIDVTNTKRLFPGPSASDLGHPVSTSMGAISAEVVKSRSGQAKAYDALAKYFAVEIAKVFYEHETTELGSRLDPR